VHYFNLTHLTENKNLSIFTEESISRTDVKKSRELNRGLIKFLRTETFYTIRRLLAADQKDMYDKAFVPHVPDEEITYETNWKIKVNPFKGGINLTSYLTYGW
jgi:hypothetical protein